MWEDKHYSCIGGKNEEKNGNTQIVFFMQNNMVQVQLYMF
jgi:hypothetical protein